MAITACFTATHVAKVSSGTSNHTGTGFNEIPHNVVCSNLRFTLLWVRQFFPNITLASFMIAYHSATVCNRNQIRCMTKGVTLSESSDSGILNAEPSILTVISNLSRFILSAYSQVISLVLILRSRSLSQPTGFMSNLPQFERAQVIDSPRHTIRLPHLFDHAQQL